MLPYGTNKNYLDWDDNEAHAAARREHKIIIEEGLDEIMQNQELEAEEELEKMYGCGNGDYYFDDDYEEYYSKEPVRLTYYPILLYR